jgi:protein N-terminal amidase
MDLNPHPQVTWTLGGGPYEMADYCLANKSDLLIMLNAWLDSGEDEQADEDWRTLNYWAARLRPLWAKDADGSPESPTNSERRNASPDSRRTVVLVCNRCGEENGNKIIDRVTI